MTRDPQTGSYLGGYAALLDWVDNYGLTAENALAVHARHLRQSAHEAEDGGMLALASSLRDSAVNADRAAAALCQVMGHPDDEDDPE